MPDLLHGKQEEVYAHAVSYPEPPIKFAYSGQSTDNLFFRTGGSMKTIATLLASFVLAACATPATTGSADSARMEILAATDSWRTAYDSRDPVRIAGMYGKGAVLWGTTMKSIGTSPAAISEYFKDAASRPNARVVFNEQHVRVHGDLGVNSGSYTFTDKRDGKDIANPARYSMVFQRQGGAWVVIDHHSSRVP